MEVICRGCLMICEELTELLQYTEKNRRLYIYCTGIQVKRNDAFPFQLCKGCYVNMKLACKFKKQCRTSDKCFKEFLNLKNNGETTDFSSYLKNREDADLLRFPLLCTQQMPKDDEVVSTTTSIRNFVKDLLQPDEIPDTEARIIREVIAEEADVLDDSLDSHWLQDDVSIDTDFRFSFSPFSTPQSKKDRNGYCTPKIAIEPEDLESVDGKDNESLKEVYDTEKFHAAKRILLNTASLDEIRNLPEQLSSITESLEFEEDHNSVQTDPLSLEGENPNAAGLEKDQISEGIAMDIDDDDTFIASKKMLLNLEKKVKKRHRLHPGKPPFLSIAEESSSEENSVDEDAKSKQDTSEKDIALKVADKSDKNHSKVSIGKSLELAFVEYTKQSDLAGIDKDSIDKNLEKALQDSENEEIPLNAIIATLSVKSKNEDLEEPTDQQHPLKAIATPSIRSGVSEGATAIINDILFGENLETSNPTKAGHTIEVYQPVQGNDDNILNDFFNKETGEYVGEHKDPLNEETHEKDLQVNKPEEISDRPPLEPCKVKYDLSNMSCITCNKKYATAKGLRIHVCKKHNYKIDPIPVGEKTEEHACPICARVFSRYTYLKRHLKCGACKDKGKKITCKFCSLEFTSQARLTVHMKTHNNKNFERKSPKYKRVTTIEVCHICGHKSNSHTNMRIHKKRHYKQTSCECSVCGLGFYRPSDMLRHLRTHSGIHPYYCKYCTKTFVRSDQLNRHMKIHTGEKNHRCSRCNKYFHSRSALNKHISSPIPCTQSDTSETQPEEQCYVTEETGIVVDAYVHSGEIIETHEVLMEFEVMQSNSEDLPSISGKLESLSGNEIFPLGSNEIGLHLLHDGKDVVNCFSEDVKRSENEEKDKTDCIKTTDDIGLNLLLDEKEETECVAKDAKELQNNQEAISSATFDSDLNLIYDEKQKTDYIVGEPSENSEKYPKSAEENSLIANKIGLHLLLDEKDGCND